jgi:putative secretion ATPase (PEP-CTERM system associated)
MYEQFYGFTHRPFQLSPDARFFFNSGTHKRALAYLRYGIEQGEGFIVVTGEVGTGKTTLVGKLFQSLDTKSIVAARLVSTQIQADDMLRLVAAEYGLPFDRLSKAALLHKLEQYFRVCAQEGKRVLLVVDEAQNLTRRTVEELRMLSNFQWKGKPLVQSLLLGQREFRTMMRSEGFEQLRQRVLAAYHLQPLSEEELRQYVEHRLKLVGWSGDPYIDDDVYARLYEFTGGVPRKTNLLCDRILLYGCLEELHHLTRGVVDTVLEDVRQELWSRESDDELPQVTVDDYSEPAPRMTRDVAPRSQQADTPAAEAALRTEEPGGALPRSGDDIGSSVRSDDTGTHLRSVISELREELRRLKEEMDVFRSSPKRAPRKSAAKAEKAQGREASDPEPL